MKNIGLIPNASTDYTRSNQREKILEHLFLGKLLQYLWKRKELNVEISRPEVDSYGYDLILECNNITRHIQVKASHINATTGHVDISTNLENKPSGCVIWLWFDSESMEFKKILWFGNSLGKLSLRGNKISKKTTGNSTGYKAERPGHRQVSKSRFITIDGDMGAVAQKLFGI